MGKVVIELTDEEVQWVEAILMDEDEEEAYQFIRRAIKPKLRSKTNPSLDSGTTSGIMSR